MKMGLRAAKSICDAFGFGEMKGLEKDGMACGCSNQE
jgi:hypothetical protein